MRTNPEGQGYVLPAPSDATCPVSREGIATHGVMAICARDMRVGAVISDQPPVTKGSSTDTTIRTKNKCKNRGGDRYIDDVRGILMSLKTGWR